MGNFASSNSPFSQKFLILKVPQGHLNIILAWKGVIKQGGTICLMMQKTATFNVL